MKRYAFVLSGNTFPHREVIKARGFSWQKDSGVWAKEKSVGDFQGNLALRDWVKTLKGVTLTEEFADKYIVGSKRWYKSNWAI